MTTEQVFLQALIATSPNGVLAADKDGRIIFFNSRAEDLLGYTAEEVLGVPISSLYCDPQETRRIGMLLRMAPDGRLHDYNTLVRHRNGSQVPVYLSAAWLRDESGQTLGSVGHYQVLAPAARTSVESTVAMLDTSSPDAKPRALRVFLCHSSGDKPVVRDLYRRLRDARIDVWLDEEDILPGQTWQLAISEAIRETDIVVVCLSNESLNRRGYVQKEIREILDEADKQPEGAIFVVPCKLEACAIPRRLSTVHAVNLFEVSGYERLLKALKSRASSLGHVTVAIEARLARPR